MEAVTRNALVAQSFGGATTGFGCAGFGAEDDPDGIAEDGGADEDGAELGGAEEGALLAGGANLPTSEAGMGLACLDVPEDNAAKPQMINTIATTAAPMAAALRRQYTRSGSGPEGSIILLDSSLAALLVR